MYWCNSKKLLAAIVCGLYFIVILPACKPAIQQNAGLKYFDVKGFFEKESVRLTKLNPLIVKSVYHNGATESKKVHIDNWGTELGLFSGSDINRPAWKDSYNVIAEGNILMYKTKDTLLNTREILIKQVNGRVEYMLIYNHSKNLLYTNDEVLTYFPDSLYQINKIQSVRLLGTNKYQIKGFFNQR
jgi:hypothetical protein